MRNVSVLLSLCLILFFAAGCKKSDTAKTVENISVFKGSEQCAFPGEAYPEPLFLQINGTYDGKKIVPLEKEKVRFKVREGSDLKLDRTEAVSDAGGMVMLQVTAGGKTGDQYLDIIPESNPEKAQSVRFVSGVKIFGEKQEARSGQYLQNPLKVEVRGPEGKPVAGVPVFLIPELGGKMQPELDQTELKTDVNGIAETRVRLANGTGVGMISIQVDGSSKLDNPVRSLTIKEMGINFYTLLINIFGGLAIFIFGMTHMSDGLQKVAGEKMRTILHFFSSNRYVAVLAGAVVTAVIQSSSASTVMVIGFVNAGLLNLVQSIGIIFGANIGTTVTAQIVAFDVAAITMPAIILGLLISFIPWIKLRGWGETILGFGLLFFGMTLMSSEMRLIGDFERFRNIFLTFDCAPVNGSIPLISLIGALMIGLIVTVIIQSSSAATGIIIALGAGGLINLYTAVALILGSNIGTTITAQLAALPANRVAKQTALAHTLFNVIGVILIVATFWIPWGHTRIPVFFYLVDQLTNGDAFARIPQNVPRHIANAHTLFNVITTLILMPFISIFALICTKVIPVGAKKIKYQLLEPHLLDTPTLALEQTVFALRKMVKKSWKMFDRAVTQNFLTATMNDEIADTLRKKEERIDRYQLEIMEYLSRITRKGLSDSQSKLVPPLMHCTNDAERIADRTKNIVQLIRRMKDVSIAFSPAALEEIAELHGILARQAQDAIASLDSFNPEAVQDAMQAVREIRLKAEQLEIHHIQRLNHSECNVEAGILYAEFLSEVSAVSRHLDNISSRSLTIKEHYMAMHKKP